MKKSKAMLMICMLALIFVSLFTVTVFAAKTVEKNVVLFDDAFAEGVTVSDTALIVSDEKYIGSSSFKVGSWKLPELTFGATSDLSEFIDGNPTTGGKLSFYLKRNAVSDGDIFEINLYSGDASYRAFIDFAVGSETNWTFYEIDLDSYADQWYNSSVADFDKTKVDKIQMRSRGSFTSYIDDIKFSSTSVVSGEIEEVTLINYYDEYVHTNTVQGEEDSPIWYSYGYKITEDAESTDFSYSGTKALKLTLDSGWQSYGIYGKANDFSALWENTYLKFYVKSTSDVALFVSPAYRMNNKSDNVASVQYTINSTSAWQEVRIPMDYFTDFNDYTDVFSGIRICHNSTTNSGVSVYIDDMKVVCEKEIPTLSAELFVNEEAVDSPAFGDATVKVETSSEKGNILVACYSSDVSLEFVKIVPAPKELSIDVPLGNIDAVDRIKVMLFDLENLIPMTSFDVIE